MPRPRPPGGRHPAGDVRLVPMTILERDAALDREAAEYGEAKARAGYWPHEVARVRARKEIAALVGPDPAKRGHTFYFGVDARGRRVGWVWIGPVPGRRANPRKRWLFQIVVDESLRGQGYGRGLLAEVERHLADRGVELLGLNVFRWNSVALALYSSSGYDIVHETEKNLVMRKALIRT